MNNCVCQQGINIVQGDDTNALNNSILFTLETELDLTGYSAIFQVEEIQYKWNDIRSKELYLVLNKEQTAKLTPGTQFGALKIFEPSGLATTVIRNIKINVLPMVVNNPED